MIDMSAYQQQAKTTARYAPEDALHYLIPGLRCEVDEFTATNVGSDEERLELGDIAWFTVVLMDALGSRAVTMRNIEKYPPFGLDTTAHAITNRWVKVVRDKRGVLSAQDTDFILSECGKLLAALASFAEFRGWELEGVLQANLDKLAQRYAGVTTA